MANTEYSLREKKHARTKIGLMNAFMERLETSRFEEISIKEVCRDLEIAEGTFFNYFPKKLDVIVYYLLLTNVKMSWTANRETPASRYLPRIDSLFLQISERLKNNNVIFQIISVLLAQNERPKKIAISALEKRLAFPGCEGIEKIPAMAIDEWLTGCIKSALKNRELPPKTKVEDVVVSLVTIITGTLLAVRFNNSKSREYHYLRQLKALWKGLGV